MSKFIWTENTSDGFKIVTSFSANRIIVKLTDKLQWMIYDELNDVGGGQYNLLDKFSVFDSIGKLIGDWEEYKKIFRDKKKWEEKQIKAVAWSTGKKLYKHYVKQATAQMNVLISTVEEKKIRLHKRIFSVIGPKQYKAFNHFDFFLQTKYCLSDMMKSPILCMLDCHKLTHHEIDKNILLDENYKRTQEKTFTNANKNFWKTIFGLKKSNERILHLLYLTLPRHYENFVEFYFTLKFYESFYVEFGGGRKDGAKTDLKGKFFAFTTKKEIKKSIDIYNRFTHNNLGLRKLHEIDLFINFLADMPIDENFNGKLPEYTRRVCRWHDEENKKSLDKMPDGPTKLPSIPLPKSKNIIFLDSKRKIINEGKVMRHCVGSYAKKAENGNCFIFHIDYNGESATVEVDHTGEVRQAYGPSNRINKAATYGKRTLNAWGKGLRPMSKEGCMVGADGDDENIPF